MHQVQVVAAVRMAPFARPSASGAGFHAALMELCRTLRRGFIDGYRPERHYMRGPGPKCREKARLQGAAR